ncbi:uncharacterized protein LOC143898253 [Temnothorax americanus]|uniref:uncharacterized protein LOC143898253 n=1 Tax=Temnothorax americanus TaxID=1964332 RepID=UPI0040683BF6
MEEKMEQPPSYTSTSLYPDLQPPPTMPLAPHTVHTIITATVFGKENQRMTCPRCNADISTRVESAANMKTTSARITPLFRRMLLLRTVTLLHGFLSGPQALLSSVQFLPWRI